ncbi:retropepsin-like aspartic protease [Falsibacillus pallidus]|uniref:Aspartyl protease n=1 Tax=Falsibacillus pallidus TaxID=493781 RepID=A0A370G5R8_9BACI|nr:retropepsin-like aspartic protease [Falsibacillus pallidus]RDI39171.1 aspartyl protease [Falsibacillus pallidus]
MDHFDAWERFNFTENDVYSNEEKEFASVLKFIIEGSDLSAIERLKPLFKESQTPQIRSCSAELLFNLYFNRGDWPELNQLGLLDDPAIDESSRQIAKACLQVEPVAFSFPPTSVDIPMELSLSGSPTVDVFINGRKKRVWLDTGAGMTVISSSLAVDCGIEVGRGSGIEVGSSTDKSMETDLAFIESIKIDGLSILRQPALVLSDEMLTIANPKTGEQIVIDGILGWDLMLHLCIELDYLRKKVRIEEPVQNADGENNLFFCGYPIVKVMAEDQSTLYFGLDTGANKTYFGSPLLSKVNGLELEKRTIHVGGIGEVKEVEIDSIKQLNLLLKDGQPITFYDVRKVLPDYAAFFKLDGVFGSDIAKDGRIFIDYYNRRIEFN